MKALLIVTSLLFLVLLASTAWSQEDPCSERCLFAGECTLSDGNCLVGSDEDCALSEGCAMEGRCAKVGARCEPSQAAHCESSAYCLMEGACTFDPQRGCILASDEDCARSEVCQYSGGCKLIFGRCQPGSAEDCSSSLGCEQDGACSYLLGACQANSDADCAQSDECTLHGRCAFDGGSRCVAASDDDCSRQAACTDQGRCHYDSKAKECVASDSADCGASKDCASDGACTMKDGRCVVGTSDCAALCASEGRCKATESGDTCVATKDSECVASDGCARSGRCSLIDERCRPGNRKDCASSKDCEAYGRCDFIDVSKKDSLLLLAMAGTPTEDYCGPTKDTHCTKACGISGHCAFVAGGDSVMARCEPRTSADCEASKLCETDGKCLFSYLLVPSCGDENLGLLGTSDMENIFGSAANAEVESVWGDVGTVDVDYDSLSGLSSGAILDGEDWAEAEGSGKISTGGGGGTLSGTSYGYEEPVELDVILSISVTKLGGALPKAALTSKFMSEKNELNTLMAGQLEKNQRASLVLELELAKDGSVAALEIDDVKGLEKDLAESLREAVKTWQFEGADASTEATLKLSFLGT